MSNMPTLDTYNLFDETFTPLSYYNKLRLDFIMNGTSWILNLGLFFYIRFRKDIWNNLKSTIVFVTTGSLILNIPQLLFQIWMFSHLSFGIQPAYSIFVCSFLKNFCMSTTSAFQVLPFAVSIYRYRSVVLKQRPSDYFVIYVHTIVTIIFIIYAFLNYPFGVNMNNDVCYVLRFSIIMEIIKSCSTFIFNLYAIVMNCLILKFLINLKSDSDYLQRQQMQLTQSLLLQSIIPVLVSLPMLIGSFEYYLNLNVFNAFASTWYATSFLDPFLMPFASLLGLKTVRKQICNFLCCLQLSKYRKCAVSAISPPKIQKLAEQRKPEGTENTFSVHDGIC